MRILVIFILLTLFGALSCSQKKEGEVETQGELTEFWSDVYIDSITFKHYKRQHRPYLLSSRTYAFNDSMSEVLDSMDVNRLVKMNSSDRSYAEPLLYELSGDTLVVDLIYTPGYGKFPFGEIRGQGDSIYLKLSGDVFKKLPRIPERFRVRYRYFRSEFKILIDSTRTYTVFFRYNDSFEKLGSKGKENRP